MPGPVASLKPDTQKATQILTSHWEEVLSKPTAPQYIKDEDLRRKISRLVRSATKSYRYAILTQPLAKATDHSLNCLSLQAKAGPRAFDARSFCKRVILPFERQILGGLLGMSSDPYVSKPLRHDVISLRYLDEIRDKEGWEELHHVLETIERENDKEFTSNVLRQILSEIARDWMEQMEPPIPPSMNMQQLREVMRQYLSEPSGGVRLQMTVYALLESANEKVGLYREIKTEKVTAPDISTGRAADVECYDLEDNLKLAVAVTEILRAAKLEEDLRKATERKVQNLIVVTREIREENQIKALLKRYADRVNVTILKPHDLIESMISFLEGETLVKFVANLGKALKDFAYYRDFGRWSKLLTEIR
jgi:hypothetical protein